MICPEFFAVTMIVIEVGEYCQGDALDDVALVLNMKERGRGFSGKNVTWRSCIV